MTARVPMERSWARRSSWPAMGTLGSLSRMRGYRRARGHKLELWVDPHKAHLFNPRNGAHLTL